MPRQVLAPMEILAANTAMKRGCFVLSLVTCEVGRVSTGVLTDVTLENLFSSMRPLVGD